LQWLLQRRLETLLEPLLVSVQEDRKHSGLSLYSQPSYELSPEVSAVLVVLVVVVAMVLEQVSMPLLEPCRLSKVL